MKKLLLVLLTTTIMTSVFAPKSQAGIVVLVTSSFGFHSLFKCPPAGDSDCYMGTTTLGVVSAGGFLGATYPIAALAATAAGVFAPTVWTAWIVLSEDGSLEQDELEGILTEKYPFIADREAISDLASKLKGKVKSSTPDEEGKITVSLTKEEIAEILEPTDLTETEILHVQNDLK